MKTYRRLFLFALFAVCVKPGHCDDAANVNLVRSAVQRCTLNQAGTKPFHLKASLSPSRPDRGTDRTGEVEIWWAAPTKWRREVRSPHFHQIAVVNGSDEWQKNEGDYFPQWLRETAIELINPVPDLDDVLKQVKDADVRNLGGNTYFQWTIMSTDGGVQTGMGAGVSVNNRTGLLFTAGGTGWGGWFRDYQSFHNREISRLVASGTPEVTAKVIVLDDLKDVPKDWFDAKAAGADSPLLRTITIPESALRANLLPMDAISWPPLKSGPFEGTATTIITVDRSGSVRQVDSIVSNNSAINDAAQHVFESMRFKPYFENGVPVQVVSRMSLQYKAGGPEPSPK